MKKALLNVTSRKWYYGSSVSISSNAIDKTFHSALIRCAAASGQRASYHHSTSQLSSDDSSSPPPSPPPPPPLNKVDTSSSVDDVSEALRNSLLRAPFQRVGGGGKALFPWRSTNQIMDRLVPGSEEFERHGYLLGGNVISSNPMFDSYMTAYLFMGVPLGEMLFFQQWQEDTAENMAWAFSQGMSGILSNVFDQSFETLSKERQLGFDSSATVVDGGNGSAGLSDEFLEPMVQKELRTLFQDARKFGRDQIQVRLNCKPTRGHFVNLFVFPFLSRNLIQKQPQIKEKYNQLLEYMGTNPRDAMPIYNEFVKEFGTRGWTEHTVIAQVLVPCEEVFWVKDLRTGSIIQGSEDETPRTVVHLVRMEMVVRSHPSDGFFPFAHEQGNWQLTDIDDLLGGNLIL